MKKVITYALILSIGIASGFYMFGLINPDFKDLSSKEMQERITKERDIAIGKAVMDGDYRCCINPPCTMCFMEANKWNNFTAGTCACDDLIARGEEPCPQCGRGLEDIHSDDNTFCDLNADVATCDSTK